MTDRIRARYWIETAFPLQEAAETMAGEQSTGTFIRVPGETDELRERFAARVEQILELGEVGAPSLPGSGRPKAGAGRRRAAEVTLSWPLFPRYGYRYRGTLRARPRRAAQATPRTEETAEGTIASRT